MFYEDKDAYKLLTVIREMIKVGRPYQSPLLSDYVSEDYCSDAVEELAEIPPYNFNDKPHQFIIDALDTFLGIQAEIWSEEKEIELMKYSDDPKSWKHEIARRRVIIRTLKSRIKISNQALSTLEDWVRTDDLCYTRLAAK